MSNDYEDPDYTRGTKKDKKRGKKGKKKRHILSDLIILIALIVFAVAAYKLIKIQLEYKEGEDEYKKVVEIALTPPEEGQEDAGNGINWDELRAINPDIVAWIQFDEPAIINYPVVHTTDNEYYLHHSFGANFINAGTIFIDCNNKPDLTDSNTFIYGHHMNNGTMFAELKEYRDEGFYRSYPNFRIYTPDGATHTYTIFAVDIVHTDSNEALASQISFAKAEDFAKFLANVKSNSLYDTGVEVNATNRIVSLYTCTNLREADRFVVYGVENGAVNNNWKTTGPTDQLQGTPQPDAAQPDPAQQNAEDAATQTDEE